MTAQRLLNWPDSDWASNVKQTHTYICPLYVILTAESLVSEAGRSWYLVQHQFGWRFDLCAVSAGKQCKSAITTRCIPCPPPPCIQEAMVSDGMCGLDDNEASSSKNWYAGGTVCPLLFGEHGTLALLLQWVLSRVQHFDRHQR